MLNGIPDVRRDPVFIAAVLSLQAIHAERIAELKTAYGIVGLNETGGEVRPELRLCNMSSRKMFDGHEPRVGDVVAIGNMYGDSECSVLVCRLARHHGDYADWPECPNNPGSIYRFAWSVDPICDHVFASRGLQAGRRPS